MKKLGEKCYWKKRTSLGVFNLSEKQCNSIKYGKPQLKKCNIVYIDKTTLYVHLIKLESSDQRDNNKRIRMIYEILDDSIEREMESRKCFNDIRISISKVIECFGGKENVPGSSIRMDRKYSYFPSALTH